MSRFAGFGNALHSGRKSYPFVGRARLWLVLAGALVVLSLLVPVAKGGFNLGIDFTGGSEFTVSSVADPDVGTGQDAVAASSDAAEVEVTEIAPGTVRVQTEQLDDDDSPFPAQTAVEHAEWGPGIVMRVEDDRVVVLFDEVGYKTLALAAVLEHDLLERRDT